MQEDAQDYLDAIQEGIKPEDARYLLPEATKTNLVATINVRELFHIFDMRMDKAAQWEIRNLVTAMYEACKGINREWRELMEVRA
jgi:thymidylate synthase (FAD)